MSIGLTLLGSLSASSTKEFVKIQVPTDYLIGETEKKAFSVVLGHVLQYGKFPSPSTLESAGIVLPAASEPAQFYVDQMRDRWLHRNVKQTVLDIQGLLNAGNPMAAQTLLMDQAAALNCTMNSTRIVDFAFEGGRIILEEFHKKVTFGAEGDLVFGWPTLDQMTGGLTGGDVVTFVGRPAMGKTYLMLHAAISAWKNGFVPMFVSMEMKPTPIVQRLGAMVSAIPITDVKDGFMTTSQQQKMAKVMGAAKKAAHPFWVIDGNLTSTPEDIVLLARQLKPNVIYIDAAYLLRSKNKYLSRWDRVTENMEYVKGDMAEGLNLPVVISYQLNREAEKKKKTKKGTPGLEDIAYTDAIGQLSSVVLGLFQDDNVETLQQRMVSILKGRNGEIGEFSINWLFSQGVGPDSAMDFTERSADTIGDLNFI